MKKLYLAFSFVSPNHIALESFLSSESPDPLSGILLQIPTFIPFLTTHGFYILSLAALLLLSALIAGTETAFFSLTSQQRNVCHESHRNVDKMILHLLEQPHRLLATLLISLNLANVGFVVLSTHLLYEMAGIATSQALFFTFIMVLTFAIILFSELLPKIYARQHQLIFLHWTTYPVLFLTKLFKPLSMPLMALSSFVEKRIERKGYQISADELHHALEISTGKEATIKEKDLLRGVVNFGNTTVRQVMRSRVDITAFDTSWNFHELLDKINKSGYSRVPVFKETLDKIEGVLYIKDLLPHIEADEHFKWQALVHGAFFVHENKKIDDLLADFQERRVHIALVVNEYGEMRGLVTMEDLVEEIMGEIHDESDGEENGYQQLSDNLYAFEGKTSLNDFCRILGIEPSIFDAIQGDSESLAGLMLELFARIPNTGEITKHQDFEFKIMAVDNKRIRRIQVLRQTPAIEMPMTND